MLLLLVPTCPFLNGCCLVRASFFGFLHFSSSLSVLCSHLSPAALNSNPPCLKMAHCCKVSNAKSLFIGLKKLFWQFRSRQHTITWEMCKCQWTITPSMLNDWLHWKQTHKCLRNNFKLSGNSLSVFWEIRTYTSTAVDFRTNMVKYGWVGRSAWITHLGISPCPKSSWMLHGKHTLACLHVQVQLGDILVTYLALSPCPSPAGWYTGNLPCLVSMSKSSWVIYW